MRLMQNICLALALSAFSEAWASPVDTSWKDKVTSWLQAYEAGALSREGLVKLLVEAKPERGTLDHVTLHVKDLEQTSRLYQEVFGLPLLRNENQTHYLGVGTSFLGLQPSGEEPARLDHFCLGVPGFDPVVIAKRLRERGLKVEGGEAGTDTLRFVDPDGLKIQVCATDYAINQTRPR